MESKWRQQMRGSSGILLRNYYYRKRASPLAAWLPRLPWQPPAPAAAAAVSINASNASSSAANPLQQELVVDFDDHTKSINTLLDQLECDRQHGLTEEQASSRLQEFGPNSQQLETPLVLQLLSCCCCPAPLLLCAATAAASFAAFSDNSDNSVKGILLRLPLPLLLLASAFATVLQTLLQDRKAAAAAQKLQQQQQQQNLSARVIRGGREQQVAASDLVVGDLLLVRKGDTVPADLRVLECSDCAVDKAAVTGSAEPQALGLECSSESALETCNLALTGSTVLRGTASGVVVRTGDNCLGVVPQFDPSAVVVFAEIRKLEIFRIAFAAVLALALLVALATSGHSVAESLALSLAFACAGSADWLLPLCRLCVAQAATRMAAAGCLPTVPAATEQLAAVDVICSGPELLSGSRATVENIWVGGCRLSPSDITKRVAECRELLCTAALCCLDCGHCTPDKAAVAACCEAALPGLGDSVADLRRRFLRVGDTQLPSSVRLTACCFADTRSQTQQVWVLHGDAAAALQQCDTVAVGCRSEPLSDSWRQRCLDACAAFAASGQEVLAICHRLQQRPAAADLDSGGAISGSDSCSTESAANYRLLGLLSVRRSPPESAAAAAAAADAVAACKRFGVHVVMATGASAAAAAALAVGFDPSAAVVDASAVNCYGLAKEMQREWQDGRHSLVLAGVWPERKLLVADALKSINRRAAICGTCVAELPAMRTGAVGVAAAAAVGAAADDDGAACCRSADLVLRTADLSAFVSAVKESRELVEKLKKAALLSTSLPATLASVTVGSAALGLPLPLNCPQLLLLRLLLQLLIGASATCWRREKDIDCLPPRQPPADRLLNIRFLLLSLSQQGLLQTAAAWVAFCAVAAANGFLPSGLARMRAPVRAEHLPPVSDSFGQQWAPDELHSLQLTCQTAFFCTWVLCQLLMMIAAFPRRLSALRQGVAGRQTVALVLAAAVGLVLVSHTTVAVGLGAPLRWNWWAMALPHCCLLLVVEELRRLANRTQLLGKWLRPISYY